MSGQRNVCDASGLDRITLDAATGDIRLRGADCAEEFDLADGATAEPGTVVVLDDEGRLYPCNAAYDRRVVGVVSGYGDLTPGIVLGWQDARQDRAPIALSGKVYCKVDAAFGPIRVGDLLTASPTPGHAMVATDPARAFAAVVGKALRPARDGRSLIPILVALQ